MIVLFTDFGLEGPYIGQVEAVLQAQAPGTPVIRLFSELPPFDIQAAAYLLPAFVSRFPPQTVFLCVVDPGVGSERPGVVVQADGQWFVGPNEGLFAVLARRAQQSACWVIPGVADAVASFHARDIFAPMAARLARGLPPAGEARPAACLEQPGWPDELQRVVYIDRFGNAMTGVRADQVSEDALVHINGHVLTCARTFADVARGEAFWYANANGLLELAANQAHAQHTLGLLTGMAFEIR